MPALLRHQSVYAGWLAIESITNRPDARDITCWNNARSVVADPAANLHIVWRGEVGSKFQVWYSRWDERERRWSADTVISQDTTDAGDPAIACDSSGNIFVAWITSGVLKLKRRNFISGEWDELDTLFLGGNDSAVSFTIDRNGVKHFVWLRLLGGDINRILYVAHQEDGWTGIDTLARSGVMVNSRPSISCDPVADLMVVWHQSLPNLYGIIARRWVNGVWREPETVYVGPGCKLPSIYWASDSFFVGWVAGVAGTTDNSIICRVRGQSGWGDTIQVCPYSTGDKTGPSVSADPDGNIYVAWGGADPLAGDSNRVFFRQRRCSGVWDTVIALSSFGFPGLGRNRITTVVRSGKVQVAWSEFGGPGREWDVRLRRYEMVHDVGVMRIEQVLDTVDSAGVVMPAVRVVNCGDFFEESVNVYFRWRDSVAGFKRVSVAAGDSVRVVFDSIFVDGRGRETFSCSVAVFNDINPGNDVVRGSAFVRVLDALTEVIITPVGRINEGLLRPRVRIKNRSNVGATLAVLCSIINVSQESLVYHSGRTFLLGPGVVRDTNLGEWNAVRGGYFIRVRTVLSGDMHPENDTISGGFLVVHSDVGVQEIISPPARVDSGGVVQPLAVVRNYGSEVADFSIACRIGMDYSDTANVSGLLPGDSGLVRFREWLGVKRGTQVVSCSTRLLGDVNPENDWLTQEVFVRVCDAGPEAIVCPRDTISREGFEPVVLVRNYGNETGDITVELGVFDSLERPVYQGLAVGRVAPETTAPVIFASWEPEGGGIFFVRVQTQLPGDMHPENDTISAQFYVTRRDVAVRKIVAPVDTIYQSVVTPMVRVANLGEERADFWNYFVAIRLPEETVVYRESVSLALDRGVEEDILLPDWLALPGGYLLFARVELTGDENCLNDTGWATVWVESISSQHWQELVPVPRGKTGVPIRVGSCMAGTADGVYVLKGGTGEWFCYRGQTGSWDALTPMPSGAGGGKPKRGAALCWDGNNRIYALKGRNSRELWCYDIARDSWFSEEPIPAYTAGIRYGSGLVFLPARDTGKVFCLKGSRTNDFLVFWVKYKEWHSRRPVPAGAENKPVMKGSALVAVGSRIFCLKGKTNAFYEYLVRQDTWVERACLPFSSRTGWRRAREGAALASDGIRFIYAFKGGGTREFWHYDILQDSWIELEEIPPGRRRYRVRPGGALVYCQGKVYVLKGGSSREFWCYDPNLITSSWLPSDLDRLPLTGEVISSEPGFIFTTNNFSREAMVFDITGRRQTQLNLTPGVYFAIIRDTTGQRIKTRRFVVLRKLK